MTFLSKMNLKQSITIFPRFYNGSKKYFLSALGFPPEIRQQVAKVYNFCRYVDDLVDEPDLQQGTFDECYKEYQCALKTGKSSNIVINDFIEIKNLKNIKNDWVEALFKSMRMDLNNKTYNTLEDTLEYSYGVAEVIGLMMCKVLALPEDAYEPAQKLGRSAPWINFLRDINEDLQTGRCYFPKSDFIKCGLKDLNYETVIKNKEAFRKFIELQSKRYDKWTQLGEIGYDLIPRKYIKPIIYATELDKWKLTQIKKNCTWIIENRVVI